MSGFIAGFIIAFLAFGAVSAVHQIGKPREPMTSGVASATVVVTAAICIGIAYLAGWFG